MCHPSAGEDRKDVPIVTVSPLALPPLCLTAKSLHMAFSSFRPGTMSSSSVLTPLRGSRTYRLVDAQGEPHPVLDDLYESLDAAWSEALDWWETQDLASREPIGIGVEVSTMNGDWRTIRDPGS